MNSEIERAFAAALAPVLDPTPVMPGLSGEILPEDGVVIVDASGNAESPVRGLWRVPVVFCVDLPGLVEGQDQAEKSRELKGSILAWLRDPAAVLSAFSSDQIGLLPGFQISTTRHRFEDDRLVSEIEITAGFREI